MLSNRGITVFSGGSAANSLVDVFEEVRASKGCLLSYVIPISDNGGSSSELIRVFGGPGIGDVRSRLVRLIPTNPPSSERSAIADLFNHRLSPISSSEAHSEWYTIVDGTSPLWKGISSAKKELIRSFFNTVNLEILKRSRPPTSTFDFTSAAVGNLFLTGARLFCGSFESAIYLLGSICGIPDDLVRVIPAINSNFSHHISAGLANGEVIVGQNAISHPSEPSAVELSAVQRFNNNNTTTTTKTNNRLSVGDHEAEDANLPGSLPTLRRQNIKFSKSADDEEDLPARIERIWYINPYGQEMHPPANPRVLDALRNSQAIIYSIGSLYTSIVPSLVLKGVGDAIRASPARPKILLLNGSLDREVGPSARPFAAFDFVDAIARAAEESRGSSVRQPPAPTASPSQASSSPLSHYVSHLIYLDPSAPSSNPSSSPSPPTVPVVDKAQLTAHGIETIRLYGRRAGDGRGMRYDHRALAGAIEMILGRKGDAMLNGGGGGGGRGGDGGERAGGSGDAAGGARGVGGRKGGLRRNTLDVTSGGG